jgi:hypothetical protein
LRKLPRKLLRKLLRNLLRKLLRSKTDSTGKGAVVAIAHGPRDYHPPTFVRLIGEFAPEMLLFRHTIAGYRKWLKSLIGRIGEDPRRFSLHSPRRGGGRAASIARVPDSLIKARVRRKYDCVSLYTVVSALQAGEAIGVIL